VEVPPPLRPQQRLLSSPLTREEVEEVPLLPSQRMLMGRQGRPREVRVIPAMENVAAAIR